MYIYKGHIKHIILYPSFFKFFELLSAFFHITENSFKDKMWSINHSTHKNKLLSESEV